MPPHASDSRFSLAAERRLLDSAHLALVHADPSRAAQALQRHAERFGARGLLNEEAQALRVRLLAALGKRARAAEAAQEFFRRYPNSLLRAVVESALQGRARRPR